MSDIIHETPFSGHLDESIREELADSAVHTDARNVRQDDIGATQKRLGSTVLTRSRLIGSIRTAGLKLLEHHGAPVIIDGTHLDTYASGPDKNITRSRVPECTYSLRTIPTPSSFTIIVDTEYCSGYIAVSHTSVINAQVLSHVSIIEADSGIVVRSTDLIGGGGQGYSLIGSYGQYFILFFYVSTTEIKSYILDTQNIAAGWATLVATVVASSGTALPSVCSLEDRVAIAYTTTSGASRVTVKTFDLTGLLQTSTVNTSSTTPDRISLDGRSDDTLWVAWNESDDCKVVGLDPAALTVSVTANTVFSVNNAPSALHVCAGEDGEGKLIATDDTVIESYHCFFENNGGSVDVPGTPNTMSAVGVTTRPFFQGGRYLIGMFGGAISLDDDANAQAVTIVVDWTEDVSYVRPIANIEPGLTPFPSSYSKVPALSSTARVVAIQTLRAGRITTPTRLGDPTFSAQLVTLDFASRTRWGHCTHANYTIIGGALTSVYDGEQVNEVGFLVSPTTVETALGSSPGITGDFRYVAVYEDVDAAGNVVVSGVSLPSDPITASDDEVLISTAPINISSRIARGAVRVAFYRSRSTGAPPYHRLAAVSVTTDGSSPITYTDTTSDTTLANNPLLYSTGLLPGTNNGPQDKRAPPGLTQLISYNGMLVGIKGSSLIYSGQEVYGEAPWFSPIFEVPITADGDFTAIAHQDGTIYAFKRSRIYAIAGEPPSDNGSQGGLGTPRRLATDVGCIDPNSVVVTSLGIFFQSDRGIELLDRSANVVYVGSKVQTSVAAYPVCAAAVLDTRNSLVRFSMATGESDGVVTGTGLTLVYDLTLREWISKDIYPSSEPAQSAANVYLNGAYRYAWLGTDGEVHYERDASDASAYLDGSTWITQLVVTPWLHPAGINGECTLLENVLLAKRYTGHDLTISVAFDYSDSYSSTRTFTAAQIAALAREWINREISQTTCTAVRFKFEDATPSSGSVGSGRGAAWIARTVKGEAKPGMKRMSGAQRGG